MRKRAEVDTVLLHKIFEQGSMTARETEELFGVSWGALRKIRLSMGFKEHKSITCNVCGKAKARNMYSFKSPGVCITCRMAKDGTITHGGRPELAIKTARTKCLKCNRPFLSRLGYRDQKINRICPICSRTNSFLGPGSDYPELMFG